MNNFIIFLYYRSTTAVCYYANDFAEEKVKLEHLAVRFKLEETLQNFKTVFETCQADLRNRGEGAPAAQPVILTVINILILSLAI
jgi:hypothetical protein